MILGRAPWKISPPGSGARLRASPRAFTAHRPPATTAETRAPISDLRSIAMQPEGALVLFSGGQDSTTTLAWALSRFDRVETIGFDYGERHRVELDCRKRVREALIESNGAWAERLGADH